jgi:hypothetical protein
MKRFIPLGVPGNPEGITKPDKVWLNEQELAARLGISVKTLQKDRWQGGGIPFLKARGFVRYRIEDIRAWEEAHMRVSTTTPITDANTEFAKPRNGGEQ